MVIIFYFLKWAHSLAQFMKYLVLGSIIMTFWNCGTGSSLAQHGNDIDGSSDVQVQVSPVYVRLGVNTQIYESDAIKATVSVGHDTYQSHDSLLETGFDVSKNFLIKNVQ